jgi:hypothetical protein
VIFCSWGGHYATPPEPDRSWCISNIVAGIFSVLSILKLKANAFISQVDAQTMYVHSVIIPTQQHCCVFPKNLTYRYPSGIRTRVFCSWGECDANMSVFITKMLHTWVKRMSHFFVLTHLTILTEFLMKAFLMAASATRFLQLFAINFQGSHTWGGRCLIWLYKCVVR